MTTNTDKPKKNYGFRIHSTRTCHICQRKVRATLVRKIMRNGREHVGLLSEDCNHWVKDSRGRLWIPKEEILDFRDAMVGVEYLSLQFIKDEYDHVCSVEGCDSQDGEFYHFAPKRVFGKDADNWPVLFLCTHHHAEWHKKMELPSQL